jgi:transcriptional regulator with XRE-family HTH domain
VAGNRESIPRRIQERRELAGLTQEQVARAIGRAQSNVSAYETGESVPSLDTLRRLAVTLNTTVDLLIGVDTVVEEYRRRNTPQPSSSVRPGRVG